MKLYHGTSERYLESILRNGITPRGDRAGNWQHTVTSNSRAVYMTTAYPIHFAKACVRGDERLALLEVDTDNLNIELLAPDEDFLEQATRQDAKFADCGKNMKARTLWFRKRAFSEYRHLWSSGVQHMGTCTYYGRIPPATLSRVAFVPEGHTLSRMSDPVVGIENYKLCGPYYRNLTRLAFGDVSDLEEDPLGLSRFGPGAFPDLTDIEVRNLVKTA